ncbi:MAG: M20/M25/M40 family metallo-hydrolase [Bacteroidia bacterium]|nr:M20/M25/M40 family metallo-hydrolase [Bacteroidia bacterium]
MRQIFLPALILILSFCSAQKQDSIMLSKIFAEEMLRGESYRNLESLCKNVGHRLSGSPSAQKAVDWGFHLMKSYGFDTVYLQECLVPHWVRGKKEVCEIYSKTLKAPMPLNCLALGGSVGTGEKGISAEVVEIKSWDELEFLGVKGLKGKIAFFNRPFDNALAKTFEAYGHCVDQRWAGASRASKYGAIGVLVRSMTNAIDNYPHTGSMGYNDSFPKIPAVAISTEAAEYLSKKLKQDPKLQVSLHTWCQTLPDEKSYNVIGEIWGSEKKNEFILVGGHLDSWDVGQGAHDDGAGVVQSIEVLRLFKAMGIKPKRTLRCVLYMNEENGTRGAQKYNEEVLRKKEKHIAAMESDRGGFTARGFSFDTLDARFNQIKQWAPLFHPYLMERMESGFSGVDVRHLKDYGAFTMGYYPDPQRYFDFHHTERDTFEHVHKRELEMGAACMAMMVWLISEYGI